MAVRIAVCHRLVSGRRARNELRVISAATACLPDISAVGHAGVDAGEQGVQSADVGEGVVAGARPVLGVCILAYHSRSPFAGVVPRRVGAVTAIYAACQTSCSGFADISAANRCLCIGNAAGDFWDTGSTSCNSSGIVPRGVVRGGGGNGTVEAAEFNFFTSLPTAYTSGSTTTCAIYGDLSLHDKVADRSEQNFEQSGINTGSGL